MDFSNIRHLNLKTFLLLAILLLLAYSSSFNGDWALDDDQNILTNQALHIEDLSLTSLKGTLFANPYGADGLYRPLPCFTFGLNWYFGQNNPLGYHAVNFIIHLLSAFFLFTAIKQLFKTPRLKIINLTQNRIYTIAFFAALLWALHPVHVEAVTYIVQRMASMMAMFYILGITCFLYAKNNNIRRKKVLGYTGCALAFACALLSKENAPTFPLALLVIHWVFYMQGSFANVKKKTWMLLAGCGIIIVIIIAGFAIWAWQFSNYNYAQHFQNEYFNSWERLLTQTRVIVMYLYQIFYPVPSQFQIEYYVPISISLVNPLSTLFASIFIVFLIVLAFVKTAKWPLTSFAILFFFAVHSAESSVWILEMAFEYRNYIPSMFIALPIVYGFMRLIDYCKNKHAGWRRALIAVGMAIIILIGFSTFLRNFVWHSEPNLYLSAIRHNPNVTRSYVNYGDFLMRQSRPHEALGYFEKALATANFNRYDEEIDAHFNLANAYLGMEEYAKAIAKTQQNLKNYPEKAAFFKAYLAMLYELSGDFNAAAQMHAAILRENPHDLKANVKLGLLLFKQRNYGEALTYLLQARAQMEQYKMQSQQAFIEVSQTIGISYILLGDYAKAPQYLHASLKQRQIEDAVYVILWTLGANSMTNTEPNEQLTEFLLSEPAHKLIPASFVQIANTYGVSPVFIDGLANYLQKHFAINVTIPAN